MIKIGILTFYSSINYGAFLQAYALQNFLQAYGEGKFLVEIVSYETEQAHATYRKRILNAKGSQRIKLWLQNRNFVHARKKMQMSSTHLISDSIDTFCETYSGQYDILVFGSDEIWRTDGFRSFPNAYWGNFSLGKTQYMSYACSSRSDLTKMSESDRKYIGRALENFSYIGVRDRKSKAEIEKLCCQTVNLNCDPTFLFDFKKDKTQKKRHGKPVLGIMLAHAAMRDNLIDALGENYEIRVFYTPIKKSHVQDKSFLGPFAWLREIQKCDLFITSFFHGTVFAIKYAVPFIAVSLEDRAGGKIENLIDELGMNERLVSCREFRNNEFRQDRIVRKILSVERQGVDEAYENRVRKFVMEQSQKAESFLLMLDKLVEEIEEKQRANEKERVEQKN